MLIRVSSIALVGCLGLGALGPMAPDRAIGTATGYTALQICRAAFISRIDPDAFYREAVAPLTWPVNWAMSYEIDRNREEVRAKFAGLAESRAVFRGPAGCLVTHGEVPQRPSVRNFMPASLPASAITPGLAAALDRAFQVSDDGSPAGTKAVVVIHGDRIVAERYAPGYDVSTPVIGWSITKSITNALVGILVREGKLSVLDSVPAWSMPDDPRRHITIDHLLRMTSGIGFGQSLIDSWTDAFDPAAQMLFDERDMAETALQASLAVNPGAIWCYTNGNTLVLSSIIRDLGGGGTEQGTLDFIRRELFEPLGMSSAILEFDAAGTPVGSSHLLATPRDFARFGLLYLHDGMAGERRILPRGWVDYSANLTRASDAYGYGAGFWTNRGGSSGARRRIAEGLPEDAFMARGSLGQYVIIIPSADLVIARFGVSFTPRADMGVMDRLAADVIAAVD